jgi:hypothetical protein
MEVRPRRFERQSDESAKAFAAFAAYRDMGTTRSLAKAGVKAGQKRGGNSTTFENWSRKHQWVRRAQAYDDHLDKQQRQQHAKNITEANERHRQVARVIQGKVVERIRQLAADGELSSSLVRSWQIAVQTEREALGIDGGRVGLQIPVGAPGAPEQGEVLMISLSRPDRVPGPPLELDDEDDEY